MAEGDFGVSLPVKISGTTIDTYDSVRFTVKTASNGTTIIEKDYTGIQNNTVNLTLTEAESALLPIGVYVYLLDWYRSNQFMCNIIPNAALRVVDKA